MDLMRPLLLPLAWVYAAALRARNWRYDRMRGMSVHAGVPTISVGNITVGGTGKTPMVIELVQRLAALGRRPAILTRGYGARAGGEADEVLEFRDAVPAVPVVVNADRVAGAAMAREEHGVDCLVLDDGFQHRRLRRDLDLVLIDALRPWGGGHVLPAGRLREPLVGLARADAIVLTRANQVGSEQSRAIERRIRQLAPEAPVLRAVVVATQWVGVNGATLAASELAGERVLAVCGLGNPETFFGAVRELTGDDLVVRQFADHHVYARGDVEAICGAAERRRVRSVVTTRKDWVKLRSLWPAEGPALLRLDVRLVLNEGEAALDGLLRRAMEQTA